ncbi:UDP-2,4-diacetamido-2,4,6-trideoxy-beta-L-altropyranose hydrolase [Shewanella donghaensis]|uniref:UDP-2,4-diacetamido-2,4, 6-trideoxy-beta-L-altropyranose hydrolase n=1 Tax=Shewanella donghaensis TaxID=238836 RepID=UPI0011836851|nr:UDP-2,4-diacetamido-2,4,6-trideoxy-beta-L-altropyranose hydrolase [Shewanella donghaensis]
MSTHISSETVVFRVDSSVQIGYGHLMRCLTLAVELRKQGAECYFLCRDLSGHNASILEKNDFTVYLLPAKETEQSPTCHEEAMPWHYYWLEVSWLTDVSQCMQHFKRLKPSIIIVDHYALDVNWERQAKLYCNKLMVIDDLADREHYCDFLLDYNLSVASNSYQQLIPAFCRQFLGGKYTLLRNEFLLWRTKSQVRRINNKLESILVTFGGADPDNNSEKVLEIIANLPFKLVRINVVVSDKALHLQSLKRFASRMSISTKIHTNVNNMAELMAVADLAIGSGGGSTYERLFLELPSLLKPIAKNQVEPLTQMSEQGLFTLFDSYSELKSILLTLWDTKIPKIESPVLFGVPLVSRLLLSKQVILSDVKCWDVRRTFRWLQSKELQKAFLVSSPPQISRHFSYWRSLLQAKNQFVFSIIKDGKHLGNIGVKHIDYEKSEAEAWIYIGESSEHHSGVGSAALFLLEKFIKETLLIHQVIIHVSQTNQPALSFYNKQCYKENSDSLTAEFSDKNVIQMRKNL